MKFNFRQKNNWQTKKLQIGIFLFFLIVDIMVGIFKFPQFSDRFNLLALLSTLVVLIWYTNETMLIRKESVKQTELRVMPIMVLYIRKISAVSDSVKLSIKGKYALTFQNGNSIEPSDFYIGLRNMGDGPAFDVNIESENFKAERYQTRFFAPKNDEHAVKIVKKPNDKIRNLGELDGEMFNIKCRSIDGVEYIYKYRISDIKEKMVEYVK